MKRIIFISLLISLIIFPSVSRAVGFNGFLVLDKITNTVEICDGQNRIKSFKATPKPARVIVNPDNGGYILMSRGARKKTGVLTFLDQTFKTVSQKNLPGIVVRDFYLKESGLWLFFTVSSDKKNPVSSLTCYDLKTQGTDIIPLNGPPVVYRFNEEQTQLAVGTLGSFSNNLPAELVLIELIGKETKKFPVSANPGAIYQTPSGKIVVACGGFRNNHRYPSGSPIEKTATAEKAKLHWIDPVSGETSVVQLEYLPLRIAQDRYDSEIFYAVCDNVYGDPNQESQGISLGNITNPNPNQPAATFFKIVSGKIETVLKLQNQPKHLIQASAASVCIQGTQALSIVALSDPVPKLLEYSYGREIDQFLFNQDGNIGYLSNVNSNFLNIIDLKTGKEIKTVKISKSFFLGKLFGDIFGLRYPPVIQSDPLLETENRYDNRRMFFSKDFSHLYMLAGSPEVIVFDTQINKVKSAIKFSGAQYGIHPTPDGKLIVVPTDSGWHLIDPSRTKPVFSLSFKHLLDKSEQGPENGYYSPNGKRLIIPFKNYLYLIDLDQGSFYGKVRTKARAPIIVWPE
jgi:hypothetical protein